MNVLDKDGNIIEKNVTSKKQKFLYSNIECNFFKRLLLKIFISKITAFIVNFYVKRFFSKIHIKKMVQKYQIDLNLFQKQKFCSYNDFFIRKYKKIIFDTNYNSFISPCQSNLSIYRIKNNMFYNVKNSLYTIDDILQNQKLAKEYEDGYCVIFRLAPQHYHRYIFVDDGIYKHPSVKIKGKFHTVNPISFKKFNVFKENQREYNILFTKNFGKIIQIEIGAMFIGKIVNYPKKFFSKGEEKGFFSFGGSTIIFLIKNNNVQFDSVFLKNTLNQSETQVNIGEKIGIKIIF